VEVSLGIYIASGRCMSVLAILRVGLLSRSSAVIDVESVYPKIDKRFFSAMRCSETRVARRFSTVVAMPSNTSVQVCSGW
jgi:hypothetical protein